MVRPFWYVLIFGGGVIFLVQLHAPSSGPRLLILDFGCPFSKKIEFHVKALGAYAERHPYSISTQEILAFKPDGIILSGGPSSVPEQGSPRAPDVIFQLGCPILGVCYGMQTMAEQLGGSVIKSNFEKGVMPIRVTVTSNKLLQGLGKEIKVWMRHSDEVVAMPPGFKLIGSGDQTKIAIMADQKRHWYGVQFHPEASPNPSGKGIYRNFIMLTAMRMWHHKSLK